MRKLGKELKALQGRTRLPLHAAAAIFLRYDADRIDKMRAIISGEQTIEMCKPVWESRCFCSSNKAV